MKDIFRLLKDGSEALRELGLEQAADQMVMAAEDALTYCELWLNSNLRYVLKEAEVALEAQKRRELGQDGPQRAERTWDLEEIVAAVQSPWYGESYQVQEDATVLYLPEFVRSATVRNIDDARKMRNRRNVHIYGKLKKGSN